MDKKRVEALVIVIQDAVRSKSKPKMNGAAKAAVTMTPAELVYLGACLSKAGCEDGVNQLANRLMYTNPAGETFDEGDLVYILEGKPHLTATIVGLYSDVPGGVKLDRPLNGHKSWNVSDLAHAKEAS